MNKGGLKWVVVLVFCGCKGGVGVVTSGGCGREWMGEGVLVASETKGVFACVGAAGVVPCGECGREWMGEGVLVASETEGVFDWP